MDKATTLAETTIVSILRTGTSPWNGREWRIGIGANGETVLQRMSQAYGWVTVSRDWNAQAIERKFSQITS